MVLSPQTEAIGPVGKLASSQIRLPYLSEFTDTYLVRSIFGFCVLLQLCLRSSAVTVPPAGVCPATIPLLRYSGFCDTPPHTPSTVVWLVVVRLSAALLAVQSMEAPAAREVADQVK